MLPWLSGNLLRLRLDDLLIIYRCSRGWEEDWTSEKFDDSHWDFAETIAANVDGVSNPWQRFTSIPDNALWIWKRDDSVISYPDTVFCRYKFGMDLRVLLRLFSLLISKPGL